MEVNKPHRVVRSYTQRLVGTPEQVFPLLCPVREADWIEGWEPTDVWSESGVAEDDCVFVTPAEPHAAIWYVTRHQPPMFVEMLKISPEVTACRLTIRLRATDEGCEADVTYAHTSLGPRGDDFVASFSEVYYQGFMREWETRLNHYLQHGTMLRGEEASD